MKVKKVELNQGNEGNDISSRWTSDVKTMRKLNQSRILSS